MYDLSSVCLYQSGNVARNRCRARVIGKIDRPATSRERRSKIGYFCIENLLFHAQAYGEISLSLLLDFVLCNVLNPVSLERNRERSASRVTYDMMVHAVYGMTGVGCGMGR